MYEEDDSSDVSSDILQPLAVSTDSLVSTESLVACTESLVVSTESLAPSTELKVDTRVVLGMSIHITFASLLLM